MDCHTSARGIVFPVKQLSITQTLSREFGIGDSSSETQPDIHPLSPLKLDSSDVFHPLHESSNIPDKDWSDAEQGVFHMLKEERAVVKTVNNAEWKTFLDRFLTTKRSHRRHLDDHVDIPPHNDVFSFNSFLTSTSLLPQLGRKMRCYGSTKEYRIGVVFALPKLFGNETEEDAAMRTHTWSWPSGYSAKTEFNMCSQGKLINGRQEALMNLTGLRRHNRTYLENEDYEIGGKYIKGGLSIVPYNEVYVRVGGIGYVKNEIDSISATGDNNSEVKRSGRTFENGVGLPVALFIRACQASDLVSLLRTRARMVSHLGQKDLNDIPLLLITPDLGVRVLTSTLQQQLLYSMVRDIKPFQNPILAHKTTIDQTCENHLKEKTEELIDLNSHNIRDVLTDEECARLAGGYGSTDESVIKLLMDAMQQDTLAYDQTTGDDGMCRHLRHTVMEGLTSSVRANDYYTSKQLLVSYTIVASMRHRPDHDPGKHTDCFSSLPPPLDTHILRAATNSEGLLVVLGAVEVMKAMYNESIKHRVEESVLVLDEYAVLVRDFGCFAKIAHSEGEQVDATSETQQRNIKDGDASIMTIESDNVIFDRKTFTAQLRHLLATTDFQDVSFLWRFREILSEINQPRQLGILQYIVGLDKRYSIAHLGQSTTLAVSALLEAGGGEVPDVLVDSF